MKFQKLIYTGMILLLAASVYAAKEPSKRELQIQDSLKQVQLESLRREVDALERMRLTKANELETKEAQHWRERYRENRLTEDHVQETRTLEARYSKLSTDIGRLSEEWVALKGETARLEEETQSADAAFAAFQLQVIQSVEKTLDELPGDYPVEMEKRFLKLSQAKTLGEKKNANIQEVIQIYLEDQLLRNSFTSSQSLDFKNSQIGKQADIAVDRLRLGTVFLAELPRSETANPQILLRTGQLQGKMYEWNTGLPEALNREVKTAVQQAKTQETAWIPLDVLQSKSIKNSVSGAEEQTGFQAFLEWFRLGGVVMYPLLLVAIFAVFLGIERFTTLMRRGKSDPRFMNEFNGLVAAKEFEKATLLCEKQNTSLSMILMSIVRSAHEGREFAEKSLKEMFLRELPKLEKRMGLLAALGTIAPLLGLLGTVTGIITLFTVITELGTNDARVLAGGISEALITTETGLIIAIPVMVLHGLLSEKLESVTSELYVQSSALMNKMFPKDVDE
ncbi:MAG: MotA/TolQ/ExbB proton channel family protein [Fibrobacter sp.]|jgi:biopolymer transport protein ExbB|nr:MotA/TolQ/ExbB proton channel family protein [Fibrobacter sp.]